MPLISLRFSIFESIQGITYGFSNKGDGSMNRFTEKDNRARYFREQGIDPRRVVVMGLIHGTTSTVVSGEAAGKEVAGVDGLITSEKGLYLSATGADCFVLYFYDPVRKAIGIAHAGWRGIFAGIAETMVENIAMRFGSRASDLRVALSPGIHVCHFKISPEDAVKFNQYKACVVEREGDVFVDLPAILMLQLKNEGVLDEHMEDSDVCTYCEEKNYFSYRRDAPKVVQPMVGYIGLV